MSTNNSHHIRNKAYHKEINRDQQAVTYQQPECLVPILHTGEPGTEDPSLSLVTAVVVTVHHLIASLTFGNRIDISVLIQTTIATARIFSVH